MFLVQRPFPAHPKHKVGSEKSVKGYSFQHFKQEFVILLISAPSFQKSIY